MSPSSTESKPASKPQDNRGMAGQTAGETSVCSVNQTQLIYRGYEIADLAANATFEEVAYLLLEGEKPTEAQLASFKEELAEMRPVEPDILKTIAALGKMKNGGTDLHPMSVLRTGVSFLGHVDPECEDNAPEAEMRKARRMMAKIPTLIGAMQRGRDGKPLVDPDPKLGHAENLLYLMSGEKPSELAAKVMDVSLILYAEHDFNASTFTSRVIASTEADMHSAVCGGIGALKGPLHGGANEMAMEMLREIDEFVADGKGTVGDFMERAFAEKRKLMGFGHRVYKNGDHRAGILREWGLKYATQNAPETQKWFDMGDEVQKIMLEQKNIHPNVDFPCGMTYYALGIPVPQYTPIFVASRVTGWCAHIMEQHENNRIIRPLAEYVGPELRKWND